MGLDRGRVDGGAGVDAAVTGQGFEDVVPDALAAPPVEAIVDRCVRPILGRTVAPAPARLEHVDDAGDHPAIIDPSRTATPAKQVWLDPRPSLVIQPVELPHSRSPSGNLESENTPYDQDLLSTELGCHLERRVGVHGGDARFDQRGKVLGDHVPLQHLGLAAQGVRGGAEDTACDAVQQHPDEDQQVAVGRVGSIGAA